jgi:hypothetical protein
MREGFMDVDTLVSSLGLMSEKNDALRLLESIVVDKDRRLTQQLAQVIREPAAIDDTNRFVSLLVDLPSGEYIEPLTEVIASSAPGVSSWLSDYLYAAEFVLTVFCITGRRSGAHETETAGA